MYTCVLYAARERESSRYSARAAAAARARGRVRGARPRARARGDVAARPRRELATCQGEPIHPWAVFMRRVKTRFKGRGKASR